MDPYDEERLRNEVIYLHSLWHQGPPTPPNPRPFHIPYNPRPHSWIHQYSVNLNPRPPYSVVPDPPRPLRPINSTTFKRKKKKPIKRRNSKKLTQPDPNLNSDQWPMPTQDSAPVVSGWPPLAARPTPATRPLSAEEKERNEALQAQYKARQACREFLFGSEDDMDDDDDDDDEAEEIGELFSKLFKENNELRNYYEKCWEVGEFRCLVCGVVDNKNAGKRFHDCVGLVQHSMSISRTKKKRAHRAFGNAVCNVLGWDINRLPTIVIKKVKPAQAEGGIKENADHGKDGSESSAKLNDSVSVDVEHHLGVPVKQDVEVVHETIKQADEVSNESLVSDVEWISRWPPLKPHPTPATHPLSVEEKEKIEVLQVQYKARQACREFLFGSDDNDDDDFEYDGDDMDNDDEAEDIGEFFCKLFEENNELKNYYKKHWEGGEFRCLVCGVVDNKNAGKRFHDCVGLVQHSMLISRTKKKRAHRAFGNAVCDVLGWDINRLPTIVIKKEAELAEAEGKTNENPGGGKDFSLSKDKLDDKVALEQPGEQVKQDVEVVHEIIKQVSEGEPDKSADDQVNRISENSREDRDVHHQNFELR